MSDPVIVTLLGLRVLGVAFIAVGLVLAVANVLESLGAVDPAHLGHYLRAQLLRPLLTIIAGLLLVVLSRPLAHWLAGNLSPA